LIVTHRWTSLLLGVLLLVLTTSGSILLFRPELVRWLNADAYSPSGGAPAVSLAEAFQTGAAAIEGFEPSTVMLEHGVLRVTDFEQSVTVDPATGAVLGQVDELPAWLDFTQNLHVCLLSCEGQAGFVPALVAPVPGTGWLGFEGEPVTVGGLVLGLLGLVLLFLAASGLWLWWPRPSRLRAAVTVRWSKGRFARDTDLHKVAGMVALPFLTLWAVTGTGFEFGWVEKLWFAATPGSHVEAELTSADGDGPDIGIAEAEEAAERLVPGGTVVAVESPAADDPAATYWVYLVEGLDPWAHGDYPGNVGVQVDRRTGEAEITFGMPDEPLAQTLWDSWNYPLHAGIAVNGWWRLVWLGMGLTPLVLAVTGVSTWLVRRRTRRRRRAAELAQVPAAAATPAP
jgi:uncharacterized iron-regulated membrane protein